MIFGKIERELLDIELHPICYKTKLPEKLQLLVDKEQGKCDIWEYQKNDNFHAKPSYANASDR
ncbi:MAG: hypothetical protein RMX68_033860 [Aulosira sp. ZfuVER01]|nr:hypothetical protein [Aulosira sp. ZfuVER01]MDZ7996780.1 hypothetical protein [Aulosira sp. DedVER01a]MDZ8049905.1 hypothetical protein [Aulosira sp. ZfuCHP01]